MLQITIEENDVKPFMNALFKGGAFDNFCVREAVVAARYRFEVTAEQPQNPQTDAGAEAEQNGAAAWRDIRPFVLSFIKGYKPSMMKIVFSASGDLCPQIHPNAKALFLNMQYSAKDEAVRFTTGTAQKTFALNKELDEKWELYIKQFFEGLGVKVVML